MDNVTICAECRRVPAEITEYVVEALINEKTPDEFVHAEEGTYNPISGQFWCTECYLKLGQPLGSAP